MGLSYDSLGEIMVQVAGLPMCLAGYGTENITAIGRAALYYGDINADGSLN
jgi:hypothetical protein